MHYQADLCTRGITWLYHHAGFMPSATLLQLGAWLTPMITAPNVRKYYALLGLGPKPLSKEERKKIQEFLEKIEVMLNWMRTNPNPDIEDID